MSGTGSSSSSSRPDSVVTIQISRRAGWMLLAALAIAAALVLTALRRAEPTATPVASVAKAETAPTSVKRQQPSRAAARRRESEPAPENIQVNRTRHETTVLHTDVAPVNAYGPLPASEPAAAMAETEILPVDVVPLPPSGSVTLNGAGATYPNLVYIKWFSEFNKLAPEVQISYQSIGSGGGIRQVVAGAIDFGASDGPMTDEEMRQSSNRILHIPTVLNAIVPVYNIPGVTGTVRFTGEVLAGIFLGKITSWNDPAIVSVNPGMNFPDHPIVVVHRSDGSGTTSIFTDYLSKVSSDWHDHVGSGTSVKWPIGLGGKGCEGVAGQVRQIPGAIGYIEMIYAVQNDMPYGSVRNASGTFLKAGLANITAAAASVPMPADFRVSITNPPGPTSYPIAGLTWLLVPLHAKNPESARAMASFLRWMLAVGEPMAKSLGYAPLPTTVALRLQPTIARLQ